MLDGDDNAIHMATIALQPQVWSIKEHHYQPHVIAPLHDSISHRGRGDTALRRTLRPVPTGPSLTAHLPRSLELVECIGSPSSSMLKFSNPHSRIGSMLHATYVNPASGIRVRSTYTTWTGGEIRYVDYSMIFRLKGPFAPARRILTDDSDTARSSARITLQATRKSWELPFDAFDSCSHRKSVLTLGTLC